MDAALTTLALLLAALGSGHPGTLNGGMLPGAGLDFSEFAIDTGPAPVEVSQMRPSAAFDGMNYFVVWQDGRGSTGADIYGTRVTPSGELLDPEGIAICAANNEQWSPCVAFLDSMYLVVWYDRRNEGSGDLYATRVSRSGQVLDPVGITVCRAQGAQEFPVVAAGDTCWFVAWQDNRTEWDVRGTCVSRSGVVRNPGGVAVGAAPGQQWYPAVAFNHVDFLAVWQSNQYGPLTLWGTRVTQAGGVLDPGGFFIAGDISQNLEPAAASIAAAGGDFLVAWQNARTPKYVYAKRVSGDGVPIEPTIPLPEVTLPQQSPSVSSCGDVYLVAWEEQRGSVWGIYGARISSSGTLLDTTAVPEEVGVRDKYDVAAVAGDGQWLAAWADKRFDPDQSHVFARVLDTTGAVLDSSFRVSALARFYCSYTAPALAACDSGYIAVWESNAPIGSSGWNTDICAARLNRDGTMLDTMSISVAGRARDQLTPAVACGDSNALVAWAWGSYGTGVYAARLGYDGTVLDPDWITLSTSGEAPSVAFDGTNYLVAWTQSSNIYGARVSQSGLVLDHIGISTTSREEANPAIAFDGTNYLVAWEASVDAGYIWCARVTTQGVVLDTTGHPIGGGSFPAVAFDGHNYLVAWPQNNDWKIHARLVSTEAIVDTHDLVLSDWEGDYCYDTRPSATTDGSDFVVAWLAENHNSNLILEINGEVVSPSGVLLDSFRLSARGLHDDGPAIAAGTDGRCLTLYSSVRDPNGGGRDTLPRIWGSFVSSGMGLAETPRETRVRAVLSMNPNPFTRAVRFQLGPGYARPDASLTICDAVGRCVRTLAHAQNCVLNWDGTDATGRRLPAGIYFCTLRNDAATVRLKLIKLE